MDVLPPTRTQRGKLCQQRIPLSSSGQAVKLGAGVLLFLYEGGKGVTIRAFSRPVCHGSIELDKRILGILQM